VPGRAGLPHGPALREGGIGEIPVPARQRRRRREAGAGLTASSRAICGSGTGVRSWASAGPAAGAGPWLLTSRRTTREKKIDPWHAGTTALARALAWRVRREDHGSRQASAPRIRSPDRPEVRASLGAVVMAGPRRALNHGRVSRGDSVAVIAAAVRGERRVPAPAWRARKIIAVDVGRRKLEWARQLRRDRRDQTRARCRPGRGNPRPDPEGGNGATCHREAMTAGRRTYSRRSTRDLDGTVVPGGVQTTGTCAWTCR